MDSRPRRSRRTQPGHLAGRYREDAPPPEQRGLPNQRVRNPIRALALGLLAACAARRSDRCCALLRAVGRARRKPERHLVGD
jgi:hypothetical protein